MLAMTLPESPTNPLAHGRISIGVPATQISPISSVVTAMQPSVQIFAAGPHQKTAADPVSIRMRMATDYNVSPRSKCYADGMRFLPVSPATQPPQPRLLQLAAARRRPISRSLLACLVLFAVVPASAAPWTVAAQPAALVNGAPVLFEVHAPVKLDSLSGSWLGHQLSFSYNAATKTWFVLAGVNLETNPGRYTLELTGQRTATQTPLTFTRTFMVARAQYPKIKVQLSVGKKFTEPNPEQQAQIAESVKVKQEYLGRVTPERKWDGSFKAPVDAATSDVFGSQRIFNGVAQRPHLGLDYRVPTGTPVAAMNAGTVLLARFLYFEGNCVVIDHGLGLLTLYFHLSEIRVKEGDGVQRGQEIGLSGGTGRATGPHLHVAVRWEGAYLDPARLLQLQLP
jgi:murein DD-endopeptidase MepM/ murein hydrolase activator NlpD